MKQHIYIILLCALFGFASCDKGMYDVSGEFYHRPEDLYLGIVDSVQAWTGYKKVKLYWKVKSDPRITKTVIYWNNRADSTLVEVKPQENGMQSYELGISNLVEKDYSFELQTKNNKGLFSLPKQIAITVLGDDYVNGLKNRSIAKITKKSSGEVLIDWNPIASADIVYTSIRYEDQSGQQTYRVKNDEIQTTLVNPVIEKGLQVSTCFFPKGTLDTLFSKEQKILIQ